MTGRAARTWLVTGASRGLGRAIAETALAAGDVVVATARRPETLHDLTATYGDRVVPLALDVSDRAAVFAVVRQAVDAVGRIDVLLNIAGYGLSGGVEEVSEAQARAIGRQLLRRTVGDPGGAAGDAPSGQRTHPADVEHRGHHHLPQHRSVACQQVGARRAERSGAEHRRLSS
ncbi:SDR family NAD(P)-dependent oxidoreductase [Streptomyces microflavus]|uniref:SDR family NAD(P)-dependent oxidoreductase n=1 Tax=Streptomyces microflavus TaxID=1919 RepID=UPI003F4D0FB0